ncbi:hypothetical protein JDV02_005460 [Purpureocillium takamizusanense]|uniref:Uncharacterized protein n=1 Tax=Purpureocillium takamizusanense TaxID=2060973 RepID=A0A9Q8VBS9_9HYPO|nr:uncharacterized protein JDV02_005460 [Purpureocillium takamizusanense]UNI19266.1 hypothetical protein JDV02_005460 [Purpureocillium takamizusanense]
MADPPPFLRIPRAIRLMMYEHLLDVHDSKTLNFRNHYLLPLPKSIHGDQRMRRSIYNALEPTLGRRACKATYVLADACDIHVAILAVSRQVRSEALALLYAKHTFHFGGDIEAAIHMLGDLSTTTRGVVRDIALRKGCPTTFIGNDYPSRASACGLLRTLPRLRKLSIVVGGGRPRSPWDGPRELSVSDLRLLSDTRHELLQWVRDLVGLESLEVLEMSADLAPMAPPGTSAILIFAAFSGSIETTLVDFMRLHLGMPAVAVSGSKTNLSQ